MSKWKCGICGSEFENYHAQGFDDIIYCPLCYFKEIYKREQKKTKLLQNQLQQKEKEIQDLKQKNDYLNDLEASAVEYKELKAQLQQKENENKEKVILKYDNIIKKLEKELDKEYDTYITKNVIYGKTFKAGANVFREHIKYKLQELKESDK